MEVVEIDMTLGDLKKYLNNIENEFDDCIVEISYDSEYLGIMKDNGTLIDEIRVQNYNE